MPLYIWDNYPNRKIIKQFKSNRKEFISSVNELKSNDNSVYFYFDNSLDIVRVYNYETKEEHKIYLDDNEFGDYPKTILLIKKYKLKSVIKSNGYILFRFEANKLLIMQGIVLMEDKEQYLKEGHTISYLKNIKDNWYYIEG